MKKLYAPKGNIDPAAEFRQKKENGELEPVAESQPEPVAEEPAPQPKEIAPELLDLEFGSGNNVAKEKANADLLAMFGSDTKFTSPAAVTTNTTVPPVKEKPKPAAVVPKQVPIVQPNKYAVFDFVQGPTISNNVYNIYNNVNMNISAAPSFGYGQNSTAMPHIVQFQPTYQPAPPAKTYSDDKAFKDILPKDF